MTAVLEVLSVIILIWVLVGIKPTGWDLSVYREGALTLLRDPLALYGPFVGPINDPGLPFTYPTFAAIVFLPMAIFPHWVSVTVTMLASIVLTFYVSKDLARKIATRWPKSSLFLTPLTLTSLILISGPFRDTVWFGQINILILAACYLTFVHCKSLTPFAIAIGICAGIKLTPIALLILPLAMRKVKPVIVGVATFLGTQLIGLIFQTENTLNYWMDVIRDPARVGNVGYIDNISLQGALERLGAESIVWFALALTVGLSFIALLWKLNGTVEPVVLLGIAAACPLLVSPVSWSHHWVWWPLMTYAWVVVALKLNAGARRTMFVALAVSNLVLLLSSKKIVLWSGIFPDGDIPVWGYVLPALPVIAQLLCLMLTLFCKPRVLVPVEPLGIR